MIKNNIISRLLQSKFLILILFMATILAILSPRAVRIYQIKMARSSKVDETKCKYVSTLGIKKFCAQINNCIYVDTDDLNDFEIPNKPFILVTSHSDATIPDDFEEKSKEIINSPHLLKWFSGNLTKGTEKLKHLPIGLDYHSIVINSKHEYGKIQSPLKQEEFINTLTRKQFYERELKIYCNFLHAIRGRYGLKDRADAINQVPHSLMVFENNFVSREQSWSNMVKYSFVLSPLGNGLDCHRTWEALVLGAIPIVKSSPLDPLYADLPVLIVKEWSDINLELLQATIEDFKHKQFNYHKLSLNYWRNELEAN